MAKSRPLRERPRIEAMARPTSSSAAGTWSPCAGSARAHTELRAQLGCAHPAGPRRRLCAARRAGLHRRWLHADRRRHRGGAAGPERRGAGRLPQPRRGVAASSTFAGR
ncbi:hypothetical protein ACRAWD_02280 [Caulobacter segnis]